MLSDHPPHPELNIGPTRRIYNRFFEFACGPVRFARVLAVDRCSKSTRSPASAATAPSSVVDELGSSGREVVTTRGRLVHPDQTGGDRNTSPPQFNVSSQEGRHTTVQRDIRSLTSHPRVQRAANRARQNHRFV